MISFRFKILEIKSDNISIIPQLLKSEEVLFEWNTRQMNKGEIIGFEFDEDNLFKNLFQLEEVKE